MVSRFGDTHLVFLELQKPLIHSKTMFWGNGGTSRYCLSLKKYLCKNLIKLSSAPENEKWGSKSKGHLLQAPILHSKAPRSIRNIYPRYNIALFHTWGLSRMIWVFVLRSLWDMAKARIKGWELTTFRVMIRLGPASWTISFTITNIYYWLCVSIYHIHKTSVPTRYIENHIWELY